MLLLIIFFLIAREVVISTKEIVIGGKIEIITEIINY